MPPTRLVLTDPSWDRITAAAKAQASLEIERDLQTPLELGQPIAWVTSGKVGGATAGLSHVHRVGLPQGNAAYTTCGEPIPEPAMWFPLSPVLARSLTPCGFCAMNLARVLPGVAA